MEQLVKACAKFEPEEFVILQHPLLKVLESCNDHPILILRIPGNSSCCPRVPDIRAWRRYLTLARLDHPVFVCYPDLVGRISALDTEERLCILCST